MMSEQQEVWLVDDDQSIRWVLEKALEKEDIKTRSFDGGVKVIEQLRKSPPQAIISDVRMPDTDGIELLKAIKDLVPDLPVIIMTAYSDLDRAVSAFQGGAFEYLSKPFDIDEVVRLVQRALLEQQSHFPVRSRQTSEELHEIIGSAPAMQEVFRAIGRLSSSNLTVLINGESGTGKELVAKALHRHSPRAEAPFIALNTAAIPKELLESELFGHEKGAFTGATAQRVGRFQQANGGTLFLDEIGDMPADLQTRLLRVLADGEFYRVGGHMPMRADVRVIAATHQNLEERVASGDFREDLFHRLNVIRVHVPALRDRREDIPELVQHFLLAAASDLQVEAKSVTKDTQQYLNSLSWPGNVRQLENFCRWITVMASGRDVQISDLPPELLEDEISVTNDLDWETGLRRWVESSLAQGDKAILENALPTFQRILIEAALKQTGGRRQDAAKLLGWGRNTLTRKIKELEMTV